MSLKQHMKFYASKVETRLNDSMHVLSGKAKANIREEAKLIAKDFKTMGYQINTKFQSPTMITQKDFLNLVNFWKEKGYKEGTIENKATALRHILAACGNMKANIENKELGLQSKERDILNTQNENRGCKPLTENALSSIKNKSVLAAAKLIISYGLRKDESLHATWALSKGREISKSGVLFLQGSWAKNGRPRSFKMADNGVALKEAAALVRNIQINGRVEQFRSKLDRQFDEKHLKKVTGDLSLRPHGLRHNYAQGRYLSITGLTAPSAGGLNYENMNKEQRALYHSACDTIAQEMGHSREEISRTYLGR